MLSRHHHNNYSRIPNNIVNIPLRIKNDAKAEIEVEIKIDSFQQYENNNILEENPNYIPPTRPFYPLR